MVKQVSYVPDIGDILWLDFDPQTGREQSKRRPALALLPALLSLFLQKFKKNWLVNWGSLSPVGVSNKKI